MASMMAIISKAQFEEEFADAKVGDVLPISEYRSVHKALDRLGEDGSLFLVTVRPPNEELWLVGVLVARSASSRAS